MRVQGIFNFGKWRTPRRLRHLCRLSVPPTLEALLYPYRSRTTLQPRTHTPKYIPTHGDGVGDALNHGVYKHQALSTKKPLCRACVCACDVLVLCCVMARCVWRRGKLCRIFLGVVVRRARGQPGVYQHQLQCTKKQRGGRETSQETGRQTSRRTSRQAASQ